MHRSSPAPFAVLVLAMGLCPPAQAYLNDLQGVTEMLCARNVTHILVSKEEGGLLAPVFVLAGASDYAKSMGRNMTYWMPHPSTGKPDVRSDAAMIQHIQDMLPTELKPTQAWPPTGKLLYSMLFDPPVIVTGANAVVLAADKERTPVVVVDEMSKLEGIGVPHKGGPAWSRRLKFPWMTKQVQWQMSFDMDDIGLFQRLQERRRVAIVRPQVAWERPLWKNAGAVDKSATFDYYNKLGYAVCDEAAGAPTDATIIFPAEHLHAVMELLPANPVTRYWCNAQCQQWVPAVRIPKSVKRDQREL